MWPPSLTESSRSGVTVSCGPSLTPARCSADSMLPANVWTERVCPSTLIDTDLSARL